MLQLRIFRLKWMIVFVILMCSFIQNLLAQTIFERKYQLSLNTLSNVTYGLSIDSTLDGNYLIGGISAYMPMILKVTPTGDTLWSFTYNTNCSDFMRAHPTFDGGYIVSGGNYLNTVPDFGLIKTDSYGNVLWSKRYGGSDYDLMNDIKQTSDSGYIMVGNTRSFGSGDLDVYVVKTDFLGDTLWTRTIGSTYRDDCFSVAETDDSGYVMTGFMVDSLNFGYIYLLKLNSSGDSCWLKTFFNPGGIGNCVKKTHDSGFIICGYLGFGIGGVSGYLIKTDSLGNLLWAKTYGSVSETWFYDILESSNGDLAICGATSGFSNDRDVLFLLTDSLGNYINASIFPNPGLDEGRTLTTSRNGYMISGITKADLPYNEALFLISIDSMAVSCYTYDISFNDSSVYPYYQPLIKELGHGGDVIPTTLTKYSGCRAFDICMTDQVQNTNIESTKETLVYPTLFSNLLNFNTQNFQFEFNLFDARGKLILSKSVSNKTEIPTENLSEGIYFYQIIDKDLKLFSGKLVKIND